MKKILSSILMGLALLISSQAQAEENNMAQKKVLVAYFSATGTTAGVAQKLAQAIGADLFEIKPEQPYTDADLNWRDKQSRSSLEMNDTTSRPAIASKIADIKQYDIVFIGFPIWWGREPSIIDTFVESYDFSGKKIIPFATSGSSGIGNSGQLMQKLAPKAKVLEGKRFPSDISENELKQWAAEWL